MNHPVRIAGGWSTGMSICWQSVSSGKYAKRVRGIRPEYKYFLRKMTSFRCGFQTDFELIRDGMSGRTSGRDRPPARTRNSRTQSADPESLRLGSTTGYSSVRTRLPKRLELMTPSRAFIRFTLPRSVLISPLWANIRSGCARSQLGNVLVLKRVCTSARYVSYSGLCKISKSKQKCH